MGRCFDCGRFIKRGLFNWTDHIYKECPKHNIIKLYDKTLKKLSNEKLYPKKSKTRTRI